MRPRVPLGFHLMLIGHSFSQMCVGGRLSVTMCVYIYEFLCVTDNGLLVQGKDGGVSWYTWWKKASFEKIRRLLEISE